MYAHLRVRDDQLTVELFRDNGERVHHAERDRLASEMLDSRDMLSFLIAQKLACDRLGIKLESVTVNGETVEDL